MPSQCPTADCCPSKRHETNYIYQSHTLCQAESQVQKAPYDTTGATDYWEMSMLRRTNLHLHWVLAAHVSSSIEVMAKHKQYRIRTFLKEQ